MTQDIRRYSVGDYSGYTSLDLKGSERRYRISSLTTYVMSDRGGELLIRGLSQRILFRKEILVQRFHGFELNFGLRFTHNTSVFFVYSSL
jgi:hypothetical protein